jgi:hypothetical protein
MSVRVTEDYSDIVWEIKTFDPSDLYEMRGGKKVLKSAGRVLAILSARRTDTHSSRRTRI